MQQDSFIISTYEDNPIEKIASLIREHEEIDSAFISELMDVLFHPARQDVRDNFSIKCGFGKGL